MYVYSGHQIPIHIITTIQVSTQPLPGVFIAKLQNYVEFESFKVFFISFSAKSSKSKANAILFLWLVESIIVLNFFSEQVIVVILAELLFCFFIE